MMPFSLDSTDKQETDALCHSLKKVSFDHPTRTPTTKKRHCNFQLDKDGVEDAHGVARGGVFACEVHHELGHVLAGLRRGALRGDVGERHSGQAGFHDGSRDTDPA